MTPETFASHGEMVHPRLFDLEALLDDGFDVEDIASDEGGIDVRLHRDIMRLTFRISRREAEEILYERAGSTHLTHPLLRR